MEMKITERDKKLLSFLACAVILAGMVFLAVMPLIQRGAELDDRKMELENQQWEMEQKLSLYDSLKAASERINKDLAEELQDFYPRMGSSAVDKEISGIVLEAGLQAVDMSITIPEEEAVCVPYPLSEYGAEMAGQAENASGDSANSMMNIYKAAVSLKAGGGYEKVQALLDVLNRDYPAIRVSGFSLEKLESSRSIGGVDLQPGDYLVQLNLDLYMSADR